MLWHLLHPSWNRREAGADLASRQYASARREEEAEKQTFLISWLIRMEMSLFQQSLAYPFSWFEPNRINILNIGVLYPLELTRSTADLL